MTTEAVTAPCPGCPKAQAHSRRHGGITVMCVACETVWNVVAQLVPRAEPMPQQRYAPDPAPPLPPLAISVLTGWNWVPNAEADIAAMMWCPGGNDAVNVLETDEEKATREERRMVRASNCRRRLAWMATQGAELADGSPWPTEGARYAAALRYYYGERGAKLNEWESRAAALAKRFPVEGEREALQALHGKATDDVLTMTIGNTIIGAAESAYNDDKWTSVVPPEIRKAEGARARKWREVSERWRSEAVDAALEKATAAHKNRPKPRQT